MRVVSSTSEDLKHLADFDSKALKKIPQQQLVAVNTNRVYSQISKFGSNPNRAEELDILCQALWAKNNGKNSDPSYTIMTLHDVLTCFGRNFKNHPRSSFVFVESVSK